MTRSHTGIITLSEEQCRELLKTHKARLGRVAFAEGGQTAWPTILPVNYTYWDGSVYFRTLEGSKLYTALRQQRIAFEIDEVQDQWRQGWSVVALGRLDIVRDPTVRASVDEQLRSWAADATEQLVRLEIEQLTGRRVIDTTPGG
jgi:nitroimidazol reductase NimA-like FMN-containing flavoprotein (pyridoxamine 5'-phosphate oxidase superfamily)